MRVRSKWFVLSGAVGGLLGFGALELTSGAGQAGGGGRDLVHMGVHFAVYGTALGAALGMTEGVVRRRSFWAVYGLLVGAVLGAAGGFLGGLAGQTLYAVVPVEREVESRNDLVIALDSSGSMKQHVVLGNDPWGLRIRAAKRLVRTLSRGDRVAVVDFDDVGTVLLPLTPLDSAARRRAVRAALDHIDNTGGTSLDAALLTSLEALPRESAGDRRRFIILLTDGAGIYRSSAAAAARDRGVTIHTVGLGPQVDADLLRHVAETTGGRYYPVARARDLAVAFQRILEENLLMTTYRADVEGGDGRLLALRTASWALLGLLVGLGQGVRENTRRDLVACGLGGLLGGAAGGALFNPLSAWLAAGQGTVGRGVAMVVVGACIGGTMRVLQQRMTERSERPATTLIRALPENRLAMPTRTPRPTPPATGRGRGTSGP